MLYHYFYFSNLITGIWKKNTKESNPITFQLHPAPPFVFKIRIPNAAFEIRRNWHRPNFLGRKIKSLNKFVVLSARWKTPVSKFEWRIRNSKFKITHRSRSRPSLGNLTDRASSTGRDSVLQCYRPGAV